MLPFWKEGEPEQLVLKSWSSLLGKRDSQALTRDVIKSGQSIRDGGDTGLQAALGRAPQETRNPKE